ncbi:MAG: hypothetical protein COA57_10570 [Flavobacteriales bacterium]|nr:MAG: hypothetical protein COA57_10570 [Flavobacteriales bacterium]
MNYRSLSKLTLLAIAIISFALFYQLQFLDFNYDFESYLPTDDPDLEYFFDYRQKFESDNDFVLIGIVNEKGIFEQKFLKKVAAITDSLKIIEQVTEVRSPTNIGNPVIGPLGGFTQVPWLHWDKPELYTKDSARIYSEKYLVGTFFSQDAKAVSIVLKHEEYISKEKSDRLLTSLERVIKAFDFEQVYLAGRVHGQHYYVKRIEHELSIFISISIVLVTIFLVIAFRSVWGVLVPQAVVVLTVIWIVAFIPLMGKSIDAVKMLIPSIMFVVGMSDVVHIVSKYLEELRNGKEKVEALKITFREIGLATFLTSLTTAVGFLTLLTASTNIIREFGVYTAIGVFVAFALAFSLLPSVLMLLPVPKIAFREENKLFWSKRMHAGLLFTFRNRKKILIGFTGIIALSIFSISRIDVDNFLLEDLSDNDPLKESYLFFENTFSGLRPFEMAIMVKDSTKSMLDFDVLKQIEKIENYLQADYGAGFVFSPVMLVKSMNRALNGGNKKHFKLPENENQLKKIVKKLRKFEKKIQLNRLMTRDEKLGRINGKMIDFGGKEINKRNEQLQRFIAENVNADLIDYRITGTAMLIDKNNKYLVSNLMKGLLIALGVVALLMGLLFRSVKMVVISLIPNILPLLFIGGIMGLAGIDLKVSTSIVFTIAFGIAVDDTIHFLSKLKLELNKGKSLFYAIKRTYISTGKAIVVTTLILSGGFLTLILSSFASIYYIGLLISLALVFAVIADLLLLPVLLVWFYSKQKNQ